MKVTTFVKAGVSLAAAATMSLACVSTASAAGLTDTEEDPGANGFLVGVGSDTTQDVVYGLAHDLGDGPDGLPEVSSWTATGGTSVTYRSGLSVARPNGSGPGYKALEDSIGVTAAGNAKPGDVDFSRASGFQGTAVTTTTAYTTAPQAGVITEVPFANDSISVAVQHNSPFLLSNGGKGLTEAQLASIYDGTNKYVSKLDGTLATTAVDSNYEPINALLPAPGHGSRQFFLKGLNAVDSSNFGSLGYTASNKGDTMWTSAGTPSRTTPAPYVGAIDYDGVPILEHNATVLTSNPPSGAALLIPFSGAKYIGYSNGVVADPSGKVPGTDYQLLPFDSSVGGTPHGVLPYITNGDGSLAPNPAYVSDGQEGSAKLTREVYNIIPTVVIAHPNASAKNRALYDTFVGKSSKVCQDLATIQLYGFAKDPNCGETGQSADSPSPSTLTVTPPATMTAGKSAVFTVTAQSTGNAGGTATVTINGTAHTVTIPAGAVDQTTSSATITVPTPAAGTFDIGANTDGFTPNLAGVAPAQEAPSTYTVAKATPTVKASAPKVSHTKAGKVTVTVTATGLHPTGKVTITVKKGSTTKATLSGKALVSGKYVGTLPKLAKGSYYVYVSYTGDANVKPKASTKLATLTVS